MKFFVVCFLVAAVNAAPNGKAELSNAGDLASCDNGKCLSMCIMNGWRSGYCLGNDCVCQGKLKSNGEVHSKHNQVVPHDDGVGDNCDKEACRRLCWSIGLSGSSCANGSCQCFPSRNEEKTADVALNELKSKAIACDSGKCLRTCTSGGWRTGHCQGNNCVCEGKIKSGNKEVFPQNNEVIPNGVVVSKKMADCEASNCILYCQRMGKTGGMCVKERCLCF